MWEFTSAAGLNVAVSGSNTARVISVDAASDETCERYGYDVGQPNQNPTTHPMHKDVGLGRICRIYSFKSMNELTFEFEFKGSTGVIEWDGGSGVTAGLDADGALLARTPSGLARIIAGEVRWV